MTNVHERMFPDRRIKPAAIWIPGRRTSDRATAPSYWCCALEARCVHRSFTLFCDLECECPNTGMLASCSWSKSMPKCLLNNCARSTDICLKANDFEFFEGDISKMRANNGPTFNYFTGQREFWLTCCDMSIVKPGWKLYIRLRPHVHSTQPLIIPHHSGTKEFNGR